MFYKKLHETIVVKSGDTGDLFSVNVKRIGDIQLQLYLYLSSKSAGDIDVSLSVDGDEAKRYLLDVKPGLNIIPLVCYLPVKNNSRLSISFVNHTGGQVKLLDNNRTSMSVAYVSEYE